MIMWQGEVLADEDRAREQARRRRTGHQRGVRTEPVSEPTPEEEDFRARALMAAEQVMEQASGRR